MGKTIQIIALLAYLSEKKNIWGPHLILTPSAILQHWKSHFETCCPSLKIIPYWGAINERKTLRKMWKSGHGVHREDSPSHVILTSYLVLQADEKYFNDMEWQCVVFDEAHVVASSNSLRWKKMLAMKCKSRMLLTGNPISNNVDKLGGLLQCIVPSMVEKFKKDLLFEEWELGEEEFERVYIMLKPYVLRRLKKDVESEFSL